MARSRDAALAPRRGLAARLIAALESRMSLRAWDALNHYLVQSRLIFSRSLIWIMALLFLVFTWMAFAANVGQGKTSDQVTEFAFGFLGVQGIMLAITLHMSLFESERTGRSFEMLVMRVPTAEALIWFKMRVSLLWTVLLALPFYAAAIWFFSLRPGQVLMFMLFISTSVTLVALLTCIVASFIHQGLTAGVVTLIIMMFVTSILANVPLPKFDYFNPQLYPYKEGLQGVSALKLAWIFSVNRFLTLLMAAGLWRWLRNRLRKTEKWIA